MKALDLLESFGVTLVMSPTGIVALRRRDGQTFLAFIKDGHAAATMSVYRAVLASHDCPVEPPQPDPVQRVLTDSDAGSGSFADFCYRLKYDASSERAKDVYQACVATHDAVVQVFTIEQRAALRGALRGH